jgi:HPt (histidine-containing phosphotransfer) domain-containing protein
MLSEPPHPRAAIEPRRSATLDAAALARLAELDPTGASRLIERVLRAFQASIGRLGPQLEAARRNTDRAMIRLVAHTLKSSSASIGALTLADLCARIEAASQDAGDDELNVALAPFDGVLAATLDAIETLLKERA